MAASPKPVDADFSDRGSWLSLVRDQGYRLFAAGNGRAAIVERLPVQPGPAKQQLPRSAPRNFDAWYGLKPDSRNLHRRFVLLTEVSRASHVSRSQPAGGVVAGSSRSSPWNAVRSIQPVASLESYVAKEAGKLLFFMLRSAKAREPLAATDIQRLDASAVEIGKSLGLSESDLEALRFAGLVRQCAGEVSSTAHGEVSEAACCKVPMCGNTPGATLKGEPYCKDHFICACYEWLDSCAEQLSQRPASDEVSDQLRSFLSLCIEQVTALTRAPFNQDPLERARLLDIRYTASDLRRRLRRSPRVADSRPVRLRCETPGRHWQEELRTFLISRFGAMLECQNLIRPEDWLFVERPDTGVRARARMAWRGPGKSGSFCVGLEFLDSDNFWGLCWTDPVPALSLPS